MNPNKCSNCHLVCHLSEPACPRCGHNFAGPKRAFTLGPRDQARRGFPFFSLILIGGAIAFFVYVYSGIQSEMTHIQANEPRQMANPTQGLSRSQYDQQRAGQYRNAVQNAPALVQSQKRLEETQKLMQPPPKQ